jgi:hypothetical protein
MLSTMSDSTTTNSTTTNNVSNNNIVGGGGSNIPTAVIVNNNELTHTASAATISSLISFSNAQRASELALSYGKTATGLFISSATALNQGQLKKELTLLCSRYSRPDSMNTAVSRLRSNLSTFSSSYTMVFMIVVILTILSNPTLFISIGVLAAGWSLFFTYGDKTLKIGQVELGKSEKLVILTALTTTVIVFGGVISSILSIGFTTCAIVSFHGTLKEPIMLDELDVMEKESQAVLGTTSGTTTTIKGAEIV